MSSSTGGRSSGEGVTAEGYPSVENGRLASRPDLRVGAALHSPGPAVRRALVPAVPPDRRGDGLRRSGEGIPFGPPAVPTIRHHLRPRGAVEPPRRWPAPASRAPSRVQYERLGPLYIPIYLLVWVFTGYRRH